MTEVVLTVNSRSLIYVSLDDEDQEAHTPNHLQSEMFANLFWKRWVKEMLPNITRRCKWHKNVKLIGVANIVLIVEENHRRNTWTKGRVVEVTTAADGQIRQAKTTSKLDDIILACSCPCSLVLKGSLPKTSELPVAMRTVFCTLSGFSCYFVSYEFIMRQRKQPSIPYTLLAGGCAGMASWLACYPIDVIKTHMQSDSLGNLAKYNGFVDCAIKGYGKEGIHFFFRGLSSTLIRAFPMNAACFFVVSWVLDFFNSKGVDMVVNPDKSLNIVNLENTNLGLQTCSSSPIDKLVRKIITNNNLEPSYDLQLTSDEVLRCSVKSYTNTTSQIDSERFTEKTK
ncbi:uncharacterized protein LOC26530003 [Drosophila willistoni]|uniref:uncharacterized protein LOC26530003 n=1 Tax=Drosophila willistoni TaxID=7260 RepID=UPI001F084F2F|nr:uncharacterized protein LOC26530003 [Drosophila willistoni]